MSSPILTDSEESKEDTTRGTVAEWAREIGPIPEEVRASAGRLLTPPYCPQIPSEKQAKFLLDFGKEALYGGAAGGGKMLSLGMQIPTPRGFYPLEEIHTNDTIFGMDGLPHVVLAESEVEIVPGWRLLFDDGSQIDAHDDHLFLTFDARELTQLTRLSDEWRARRRERRASRSAIGKGTGKAFTEAHRRVLSKSRTEWNRTNSLPKLSSPTGTLRTTKEIAATLVTSRGRRNHAIPVSSPICTPESNLPLDPYLLGVWLGDGTAHVGTVTTMDPEIVEAFEQRGFPVAWQHRKSDNQASTYRFDLLRPILKSIGVLDDKHIPKEYMWASQSQRLALLQGLLDTDGTVNDGQPEFNNTNPVLSEGAAFLARSLGHKAEVSKGRAILNGKDMGPCYDVRFSTRTQMFRIPRKANLLSLTTRRTTRFRYIVGAERINALPMKCIQVSSLDGMYLATESLIPTHNSSALLLAALQFIDVPSYAAIVFRRTYADLTKPGALLDRAHDWFGGTPGIRYDDKSHTFSFPSTATLSFGNLEVERDRFMYQSAEFQMVGFDEVTQIPESSYRYLFSRIRKPKVGPLSRVPLRMRSASNPGGLYGEWVRKRFILPWKLWKENRGPKPERSFCPAVLDDLSEHLDVEAYEQQLKELDSVTYAQLRWGNWDIRPEGRMFNPDWFKTCRRAEVPADIQWVRFWDLASTEPKPGTDPDFTSGALLGRDPRTGTFYLAHIYKFRRSPQATELAVRKTAERDGYSVPVYIEQEPGATGRIVVDTWARRVLQGYTVHGLRATGSKLVRATPLQSVAEKKHLVLVEGVWNSDFLDEAEIFPDGPHDDQIDSVSGAHMVLTRGEPSYFAYAPLSFEEPSLWKGL